MEDVKDDDRTTALLHKAMIIYVDERHSTTPKSRGERADVSSVFLVYQKLKVGFIELQSMYPPEECTGYSYLLSYDEQVPGKVLYST